MWETDLRLWDSSSSLHDMEGFAFCFNVTLVLWDPSQDIFHGIEAVSLSKKNYKKTPMTPFQTPYFQDWITVRGDAFEDFERRDDTQFYLFFSPQLSPC